MRNIKILTAIVIISGPLFFTSCFVKKAFSDKPQTVITPLGEKITVYDGSLVYALPMTVFNVTVEFEQTIEKPGPYAKFASDLLGLKDVITAERESWQIRSISVEPVEELDPSEYYIIESNTLLQFNALSLKKAGLILDLNPKYYEGDKKILDSSEKVNRMLTYPNLGANEYYVSSSDTAFRLVKLDTAFIRIPYLVERKKPLSLEQLAERAAKTLLELREGKHLILTGEANVFPQSNAAIDEINKMEKELMALFAGKTATVRKIIKYVYIPLKENAGKPYELFRFSTTSGPLPQGSNTGAAITVEAEPAGKVKDITYITRPETKESKVSNVYDRIYYRIPEVVTLRLKYQNETLYESRQLVYQLGDLVQLPANYIIGK
ncbi:MAG TPA: DUF4831 family protein [Bacteroidales bacterium]|nr:DUF4831 family protein [Bacteroidales bacterium]HRT48404.1 DUF4831 family protein [Bacteroidales bacterium]HRU57141.1 DUF4831 family protein [Bacteroidales bacterium]